MSLGLVTVLSQPDGEIRALVHHPVLFLHPAQAVLGAAIQRLGVAAHLCGFGDQGIQFAVSRRGINGAAFFFARLPESEIELDLPLIGYYPEARHPDAGIEPDLAVANRAEDLASGFDCELAAARNVVIRG